MRGWQKSVALSVVLLTAGLRAQPGDPAAALTKAEATWAAHKPNTYEFTIEVRCFCPLAPHPVSFRVNGAESSLLDDLSVTVKRTYDRYDSIDKLFAVLRRSATNQPYKMVVKYDSVFGYPVQADLDLKERVKDDELFFRVTAFKPVREGAQRSPNDGDDWRGLSFRRVNGSRARRPQIS